MRIFIDTNVIIDVLAQRQEFYKASLQVFKLCEIGKHTGCVSSLSIANIMYICRKALDKDTLENAVQNLMQIFEITSLTQRELIKALNMDFSDYEDALQAISAQANKADYIITRNVKDFKNSNIQAITPEKFLANMSVN